MMDSATSLTTTGMIAAILAGIFAIAAFSAQRRRRATREALHRRVHPAAPGTHSAADKTRGDGADADRPSLRPNLERIGTPLFKIYSIGETGANASRGDSSDAVWE